MFDSDGEKLAQLLSDILYREYERFWEAAKDAIVDLVERGYLK